MEKNTEYYLSLDKRSKEYKEWKKQQPSEGLGDTIEKITEATGIKKAVEWLAGEDCGCDKRKESLNKIWRYRKTNCLTEAEYEWLSDFFLKVAHIDQVAKENYSLYTTEYLMQSKETQPVRAALEI